MNKIVKHFTPLSAQAIHNELPGRWGDFELLDVFQHFQAEKDDERMSATLELLLRSPEITESVAYQELYFELFEHYRRNKDYARSLRWLHAVIAFVEQNEEGDNRANLRRDLAETYLRAGNFDAGLGILTHNLLSDPDDIWNYNTLALTLPRLGLAGLALEVIEHGVVRLRVDDSNQLLPQFEETLQEAKEKAATEKSRLAEITPAVLHAFRMAFAAKSADTDEDDTYPAPLDRLITIDDEQYHLLAPEILAKGNVLAADLIRMASDATLTDSPAIERSLALLRRLAQTHSIEFGELTNWLEQADGRWRSNLFSPHIGKIGGITNQALESITSDLRYNTYVRNDAAKALLERMKDDQALADQVLPLLRYVFTRPEAKRSASEETFLGFLASTIADYKVQALYPEIEAAFLEDRIDPQITDLRHIQEDMGLPVTARRFVRREDGLTLLLKCKVCGRERDHFVQHITVERTTLDQETAGKPSKYSPYIMDREIICPKCGARDQYELTPMSSLQLLMPQGEGAWATLLAGNKTGAKSSRNPRLSYMISEILNRPMHPLEGVEYYRQMIAKNPQNADFHTRLGNIFRHIRRYPQALEAFRQGYTYGRTDPDCILSYALAEHDFGDRQRAKEVYHEMITLAGKQFPPDPYFMDMAGVAVQGLRLLEKNQGKAWDLVSSTTTPPAPRTETPAPTGRPVYNAKNKMPPTKNLNKKKKKGKGRR